MFFLVYNTLAINTADDMILKMKHIISCSQLSAVFAIHFAKSLNAMYVSHCEMV